jgi:hypothetical protein
VRNNSATAAAVNTIVAISYAPMGIGMPRTPLTTLMLSLLAGETRQLSVPLPAAVLNAPVKSVGLFVDIAHPYDANLTNDHGANMIGIVLLEAGRSGVQTIALGNTTSSPITYNLSIEPNTIGATLSSTSVTVAPGATGGVGANFPAPANPPGQTEFTVVARDDSGNLLGGFTTALYFG